MKQDKKQYWAVLFNSGEIIFNATKYATVAEVVGHTIPEEDSDKFSMAKPMGSSWPKTTADDVMADPKGWVNKFGKPITNTMAKFTLMWANTKAFKQGCIFQIQNDDTPAWHKAKVWNVDGLTPSAKRRIKVGQIVKLTYQMMPNWYEEMGAVDGRGDGTAVVVPVISTGEKGKYNIIVGDFTAHII